MDGSDLPERVDVIVVGAGLAGHAAALGAAEAGAEVVVLEKCAETGGSTVLSGGFFALAGTSLQRERAIADSAELLLADLVASGGPAAHQPLLARYAAEQGEFQSWLARCGADFTAVELSAAQSVARSHRTDPVRLLEALRDRLARTGRGRIVTPADVRRLIRDGADGPVLGVEVAGDAAARPLWAAGGVVLATGGFSRSADLLERFVPEQAGALHIGGEGSTGDGLRMAWRLGADFCDMGHVKGTFGTHPTTGTRSHKILLAFYAGAIAVNAAGRRFVDESLSYKALGDACLAQPGRLAYQLFDQQVMEKSDPGVPLFDFRPALEEGTLIGADSLAGLAAKIGVPADALADAVAAYNAGVETGRDPQFGRTGLCNGAGAMTRVERAPFYAYPSMSVVLATYCGLVISPDAEVMDVEGRPISGLFAAGELTGGFHGRSYMTGTSLGKAAFFGRIAGAGAARRALADARRSA